MAIRFNWTLFFSVIAALGLTACVQGEPEDAAETEAIGTDDIGIAEDALPDEQALVSWEEEETGGSEGDEEEIWAPEASFGPELHYEGQFSYKGGWWGKSYDVVLGNWCSPGYVRDSASAYRLSGKGYCSLMGWYSSDMTDCRIRVHVGVSAFKKGTCAWQVYASEVFYFDYTASNTNNAQQNTTSTQIQLKGGETLTVATCKLPGVDASGDTFLRLLNANGQSVAHNNNGSGCGAASHLVYTAPSGVDATFQIKAGCSSATSCSGRVGYVVREHQ
ncbi:MAG TPA: hypothetical protein VLS89_05830 [Candidatus Nanopelagicales bacterium]|nr:hypothetical protein [Candidatus Nanopelagicales bacterium]